MEDETDDPISGLIQPGSSHKMDSSKEEGTEEEETTTREEADEERTKLAATLDTARDHHCDDADKGPLKKPQEDHQGGIITDLLVDLRTEIQPLPTTSTTDPSSSSARGTNNNNNHRIPGAHAVRGVPIGGTRPTTEPRRSTNTAADPLQVQPTDTAPCTTTAVDVIDGAVLVEDDNEFVVDPEGGGNPTTRRRVRDDHCCCSDGEHKSMELVEAQAMEDHNDTSRTNETTRWPLLAAVIACFLMMIAAVAILVPLLVVSHNSNNNNSTEQQEEPILYPPFQENLLNLDVINGIQDPTSFYYLANAWMQNDPNLSNYTPQRVLQRFNMVYLFYASDGPNWFHRDHWLSYTVSECQWFNRNSSLGVDGWNYHPDIPPEPICDEEGNIVVLNLTSNNLRRRVQVQQEGEGDDDDTTMTIVSSHGISPTLKIVDLSNNQLDGPVPFLADHSISLEVFVLSNNNFTGLLTGGGGFSAFNVRIVKLDGNGLFGYFPYIYKLLPRLEVMNVTGNFYDRDITTYFEYCQNLTYLGLGQNLYTGQLPSELGFLTALKELDVSDNLGLIGTIPTELGALSQLAMMKIAGTSIQGPVPPPLCDRIANSTLDFIANCTIVQCCRL